MPTEKFKYPLTEKERNELIILIAAYEQMKLRDIAGIFDITPVRIDHIIHATLQRFFPNEERLCYLTAKAAVQEYADRLLQSRELSKRLHQIREKELQLINRQFFVGETIMYAGHRQIVIEVDDQILILDNGNKARRASAHLQKVEDQPQFEIPFPRQRRTKQN